RHAARRICRRCPADGEIDWSRPAVELERLVRAVTAPYPGAFSFAGQRKLVVWDAAVVDQEPGAASGSILSTDPLRVMCGDAALEIRVGEAERGLAVAGAQLAREMGLVEGMRLGPKRAVREDRRTRVLILGVNGFIGNHLVERLLQDDRFEVHGLDISSSTIGRLLDHPRFHFVEGDISIHREWIEYH